MIKRPILRKIIGIAGAVIGTVHPRIGAALTTIATGQPVITQTGTILATPTQEPTSMFSALKGKKTYLAMALGALAIIANHFGLPIPGTTMDPANWLSDLFTMAAGATMRAGINNAVRNG